jgi:hypothetical protein
MTRWTRTTLTTLLAAGMCLPPIAMAHPRGPRAPYVVTVEDQGGRELRTFHHGGRTYVMGAYGDRYNVRIQNRTHRRVEAVLSVDGRDAVSGQKGDYKAGRGYIIAPHDSVVVEGFRTSLHGVAAFRFTDPGDSYSARMGTPENVGVIGVAIFPERQRRHVVRPRYQYTPPRRTPRGSGLGGRGDRYSSAKPKGHSHDELLDHSYSNRSSGSAPAAEAQAAPAPRASAKSRMRRESAPADDYAEGSVQNLGTEYGEHVHSDVREVAFHRASPSHPSQLISLYYDDREGLLARGIQVDPPRRYVRTHPQPFPGRFAPPPPY